MTRARLNSSETGSRQPNNSLYSTVGDLIRTYKIYLTIRTNGSQLLRGMKVRLLLVRGVDLGCFVLCVRTTTKDLPPPRVWVSYSLLLAWFWFWRHQTTMPLKTVPAHSYRQLPSYYCVALRLGVYFFGL